MYNIFSGGDQYASISLLLLITLPSVMKALYVLFASALFIKAGAQVYPPAAGQPGSTAIHKDSSIFVNWAVSCQVQRGLQDLSDPSLGYATAGDSSLVPGKAGNGTVLSLGDGGLATVLFSIPLRNGPGFDFAVFENAFDDSFLELAFVEVSSDGQHFERFPAHSLTDTLQQKGAFDPLNPTQLHNLAGKYRANYGTPFDLQELAGKPGLNIDRVTHLRVRDVVGSLNPAWCSRDAYGNKINDPWPTPFPSSGFDLDAVGVIHQDQSLSVEQSHSGRQNLSLWPNPAASASILKCGVSVEEAYLLDQGGALIPLKHQADEIVLPALESGLYILELKVSGQRFAKKLLLH